MNNNRLNQWLSLAANLGVIIGIVFLVLELRQNSAIATAQVRLEWAGGWRSIDETRQSDTFAETLAASLEQPENLSLAEMIQLNAYYWGVIDQVLSAQTASDAGVRDNPFEMTAREVATLFFANEFAQSWWKQVRVLWSTPSASGFQQVMDREIAAVQPGGEREFYMEIQRDVSRKSQTPGN